MKTTLKDIVYCEDCGMEEREEWALAGKHVCNRITDPEWMATRPTTIQVGKKKWLNIQPSPEMTETHPLFKK